jgi:hypothetical protein
MLNETYSEPNGVKSVLFDTSGLKVMGRLETIDVPVYGPVKILIYYVVGTIPYICNAFPIVKSEKPSNIQEAMSIFNDLEGNSASDLAASMTSDVLGWISVSGSVNVDAPIGGAGSFDTMPSVNSVMVENLAVANTITSAFAPADVDTEQKGEEEKRIVKWKGSLVITTT